MVSMLEKVLQQRLMPTQAEVRRPDTNSGMDARVSGPFRPYGSGPRFIHRVASRSLGDDLEAPPTIRTVEDQQIYKQKKEEDEALATHENDVDVEKIAADLAAGESAYGPLEETVGIGPWAKATLSSVPGVQGLLGDEVPGLGMGTPQERERANTFRTSLGLLREEVKRAVINSGRPGKWEQQQVLPLLPSMSWFETPGGARSNLIALRQNMSEMVLDADNLLRISKPTPSQKTKIIEGRESAKRAVSRINAMLEADTKTINSNDDAAYKALKSGTVFKDETGRRWRKP